MASPAPFAPGPLRASCLAGVVAALIVMTQDLDPEITTGRPDRRVARVPASVMRAPDLTESFEKISHFLGEYYRLDPSKFERSEAFILAHPSGTAGQPSRWISGGYHPLALGGLNAHPDVWKEFQQQIGPKLKTFAAENGYAGNPSELWSQFCAADPGSCKEDMIKACKASRNFPGDTSAAKILKVLKAKRLYSKGLQLRSEVDCEKQQPWWAGWCHLVPKAMVLFRDAPPPRVVEGVELGPAEYELIALVLTHLWTNEPMTDLLRTSRVGTFVGSDETLVGGPDGRIALSEAADNINPASMVYFLTNSLGVHPGRYHLGVENESSHEVWNHLLTAYELRLGERVELSEASELYSRAKKYSRGSPHPAKETSYVRPLTLQIELDGDPQHLSRFEAFLEFDVQGHLIGGEWLQEEHPDYLYVFKEAVEKLKIPDGPLKETENYLRSLLLRP